MKKMLWPFVILAVVTAVPVFPSWTARCLPPAAGIVCAAPGEPGPGPNSEPKGSGNPGQPQGQPVKGKVVQVDGNKVVIDVGAAEGVQPGMIFVVSHITETPLGTVAQKRAQIKVEMIQPHSTSCRLIQWLSVIHKIGPSDQVEQL